MPLTPESALAKDQRTGLAPMQHRHFSTVALILREVRQCDPTLLDAETFETLCRRFAIRLADTNPKFDRERFLAACGVE